MSQRKAHTGSRLFRRTAPAMAGVIATLAGSTVSYAQTRDPFGDTRGGQGGESNVVVSEHLTVDLHVQDENLSNVLQMLSLQSQRNIVVASDVSATVTANLYDVTFFEALESILNVNGYGFVERGNFIYVYTLAEIRAIEEAARTPISRVVKLNYLNANDAAEFVAPLLSEIGQIRTNGDAERFAITDRAPVGDETYALSAVLVLFDYPEHVEEIEKLIAQIDTRPAQVLVEATILQTEISEANAFGIDFSIIGDVNFTDFTQTGGPLSVANALQRGGTGAQGEGFSPADNRGIGAGSTPGNTGGPATFKIGVVQDDFSIFMRLLDEVTDFSVLSNPKVLALNRQPARVLVGRRVGYLNTTSTETSTTQSVEFLDTGTQLAFRPFVSNDGFIRMELSPSVSEGVIRAATDATGANVTIPDEITQELTTNVMVRDGATIVLGGLFKESTSLTRRQVPFLGDLPLIGAAFRGHEDEIDRSEIIFMITPSIVNDNVLIAEGERAGGHVERVRAGSRRGLLPWSREKLSSRLNIEAERLAMEGHGKRANWKLRRSLQLSPMQPDVYRLREQIFNQYENWPGRSMLEYIYDEQIEADIQEMEQLHPKRNARAERRAERRAAERAAREAAALEKAQAKAARDAAKAQPKQAEAIENEQPRTEVTTVDPDSQDNAFEDNQEFDFDAVFTPQDGPAPAQPADFDEDGGAPTQATAPKQAANANQQAAPRQAEPAQTGVTTTTAAPVADDNDFDAADGVPVNIDDDEWLPWDRSTERSARAAARRQRINPAITFDANGLPIVDVAQLVPDEAGEFNGIVYFSDIHAQLLSPFSPSGLAGLWRYFVDLPASNGVLTNVPDEADEK